MLFETNQFANQLTFISSDAMLNVNSVSLFHKQILPLLQYHCGNLPAQLANLYSLYHSLHKVVIRFLLLCGFFLFEK